MDAAARPLTALIVYLRPVDRARLLTCLAALDVFVVEHPGADGARQTALGTRTDFVIVVGDNLPADAALARMLLDTLASVLVALLPPGAHDGLYRAAGAIAVLRDNAPEGGFEAAIRPAITEARWLRSIGELAAEYLVFRDVRFRTAPPELERAGRSVSLTRVESEVLQELSRAVQRPVRRAELERRLASLSERPAVHGGYLKAVILRIRRKVAAIGGDPTLLRNIRGYGYMLAA